MEDIDTLMPRTKAATERSEVDIRNLKQYIKASKGDDAMTTPTKTRSGGDVRKDEEGFDDIDEFWADDDTADEEDDMSLISDQNLSSGDASMLSATSEHEIRLSLPTDRGSSDEDALDRTNLTDEAPQFENDGYDTMELEDEQDNSFVATVEKPKRSPKKSSTPTPRSALKSPGSSSRSALNVSFNDGYAGSDDASPKGKATELSASARKRRRESFGPGRGFDDISSPFSINEDPVTPLSNASIRNLDSIESFSDKESPSIRTKLFSKRNGSDESEDSDEYDSRRKSKKVKAKAKPQKPAKTPKRRTKTVYKGTPASDISMAQTDNDKSFQYTSDDTGSGDDSDWGAPRKTTLNAKERDLSFATDILRDVDSDSDAEARGLRRSKRKRYKPLEWYKGERFIYERTLSGVGLVVPTVVGVERAGADTPAKPRRKITHKPTGQRTKTEPLPKSKLPEDVKYEDGEWASLFDMAAGVQNKMNIICRSSEIELRELPSAGDDKPGLAGQSFNLRSAMPFTRWICGHVTLPPGAAKEAESVGDAVQVFYVISGQPQALEVAFGPASDDFFDPKHATHFLLNPGDGFYIPSRNAYYLKNHSGTTQCDLHFMILKPDAASYSTESPSPATTTPMKKVKKQKRTKV